MKEILQSAQLAKDSVALKLKLLRTENGLTQAQLAELLGVSQQTYSKYENGSPIDNEAIIKLCDFYGVSADYLLGIRRAPQQQKEETVSYGVGEEEIDAIVSKVMEKIKDQQ